MVNVSIRDFYRGEDIPYILLLTNDNDESIDIDGGSAVLIFKKNETDAEYALEKNGTPLTPTTDGKFYFELTSTDTASLDVSRYFYEFYYVSPVVKKRIVLAGTFKVKNSLSA